VTPYLRPAEPTVPYYGFSESKDDSALVEYWTAIYRRKFLVLAVAALGALAGYIKNLPQQPVYQAVATLEVQDKNESFLNIGDLDPNAQRYSADSKLLTEMKMLEGRQLRQRVHDKLALQSDDAPLLPDDQLSKWLNSIGFDAIGESPTRAGALEMAAATLTVSNPRMTRIVHLQSDSTDPIVASDFVNTLAQTYIDYTIENRLDSYQKVGLWLNQQLSDIQSTLQKSEDQLIKYSKESGLLLTEGVDLKMNHIQTQLLDADTDVLNKKFKYEMARSLDPNSVTPILEDSLVGAYRMELMRKESALSELKTALKPEHYRLKRLTDELKERQKQLKLEESKVIQRLHDEYKSAEGHRDVLLGAYREQADAVAGQGEKLIYYNMLKREVEASRELYSSMSKQVKQASIASALAASNVTFVDRSDPPVKPYKPQALREVVLGGSVGLFLGVVLVFVRRTTDQKFRSPGEVSLCLNTNELGAVPSVEGLRENGTLQIRMRFSGGKPGSTLPLFPSTLRKNSKEIEVWSARKSLFSESFQGVVTSILSIAEEDKCFLITSPEAGAGKTSVVSNIGMTLAEIGYRAVMVDADLRRPRLHKIFGLDNTWGLSDLIDSAKPIDSYPIEALAKPTSVDGVFVLPSGPPHPHISRLLYSSRAREIIVRLREEFDMVLIDTPPLLKVADARVLARYVDDTILVLRAGKTSRAMGAAAYSQLVQDGRSVLGTILNDWNPKMDVPYGYSSRLYQEGYGATPKSGSASPPASGSA